ncbi:MAG: translation initiation factor IF-2 [Phycisphaerae bacterium]|nr:translation initiation factor IF-2 [Phycisphaerae bacterium]
MADTKRRIHHLAKELEVSSKTIIEKCEAEGIHIKNHMHVVSAGLEQTIREWFSEGAHKTTVEESERVDLEKVRVKRRSSKKSASNEPDSSEGGEGDSGDTATAVIDEPSTQAAEEITETVETVAGRTAPAPVAAEEPAAAPEPEPVPPAVESAPREESPAVAAEAPAAVEATDAAPAEPAKPAVAGPQNVPLPAKLSGPRVVRMDKPEYVDRPRPSVRPAARGPIAPGPGRALPASDADEGDARRSRTAKAKTGSAADAAARRAHPRRGLRDERELASEQLKEWKERELLEMRDRLAAASGRGIGGLRAIEKKSPGQRMQPSRAKKQRIELTEPIIVKDFCRESGIGLNVVNKQLGILTTINSIIDTDQAQLLAAEFGIELVVMKPKTRLEALAEEFAAIKRKNLQKRSPIVTVLGHVDHGKTSLLDRIRKANVAAGEAGGITQHVGAYRVQVNDNWVTFLDTPGHAAFTAMRARGANITDVVVLVVAADDGIMPTTVEAINHARAAGATIVVALNKIDLPHDINKLYGQLAEQGLNPSEWGGETDVVKTSTVTGEGIDDLLNHLATLSDVLDLKADPSIPATGTVIEAERDERTGIMVRVVVSEGTLRTGQIIVCGSAHGRVRAMKDDKGRNIDKAGPSTPVELMGLSDLPEAGDKFYVKTNAKEAKEIAEEMAALRREGELIRLVKPTTLESMFAQAAEGEIPELNLIVRADSAGSVDALRQELSSFPSDEVKLTILHAGVGTVTDSDISLAQASGAIIIAFHVVPDPATQRKADTVGVEIRPYRIIYEAKDDIKKALEGLLEPEEKVESRGRAEVREVFNITKVGKAAGCFVREGSLHRHHRVRVVRDGVVVKDNGTLDSLRRFKDDAKEVKAGFECGLKIAGFDDVKPGDIIESFEIVKVARTLKTSS